MNTVLNDTLFLKSNPLIECNMNELQNFEKEHSIVIPDDYKMYLCQFNGAKPINTICHLTDHEGGTVLHHIYGFNHKDRYNIRLENNMLIFAEDVFGNEFAIDVYENTQNYACVYFIDREIENAIIINPSFTDFILSLTSEKSFVDDLENENPEIYARIQALKNNPQI